MNLKDLWIKIIQELAKDVSRAMIITWFKNTAIVSLEDNKLHVGLPLPFFLKWHAENLSRKTLEAAKKINPKINTISYEVIMSLGSGDPRVVDLIKYFPETTKARKLPQKNEIKYKDGAVSKIINEKYTLENFIIAPENRLAHAACQNVAKFPGKNYNPLFIYGGVGLGKTHLLQATGNEIMKNDPEAIVIYTTTENFVNEVIDCIQKRNMQRFRNKYRKVNTLIIDDIQFIANKDRTQEEFFHTFNELSQSGKQIIISSDRPPHELALLNERLVSRFESGMTVDVKMPDYETRLAILNENCQKQQVFISNDVLEFIAFNVKHSVRALEGVLTKVVAVYELEHTAPTVKSVAEIIKKTQKEVRMVGFIENDSKPRIAVTIDQLIDSVSDYYTVPKSEVIGISRSREYMVPRQMIMYLAKTKLRASLVKIGEHFNRNHTTVMHGVNKMKEQIKNDRHLLRDVNAITKEVGIA